MSDKTAKILLVEDDTSLSAVYRARLEVEGFEVKEVNNGEDALATAIEFHPNLIVLDAMMPKINGFDVLDILRNTPETANIRIIMLTALSQPKDKERAKELGADDYLVKSQVVIGDVVQRIKYHLNGGDHVQGSAPLESDSKPSNSVSDELDSAEVSDDATESDNSNDENGFSSIGEALEEEGDTGGSFSDSHNDEDGSSDDSVHDKSQDGEDGADEDLLEAALNELENTEVDENGIGVSEDKGADNPQY